MPYRQIEFSNGEIYHTILRGIDGRNLFNDQDDYFRGIFSLYEFNDSQPVSIRQKRRTRDNYKKILMGKTDQGRASANSKEFVDERDRLVDILTFCLMPNHIHLLLKQTQDSGVQKFMKKLGTGYGRYFNLKNERKGYVFQNRFQSVHIKDNNHLMTAVNYIHANPISLIESHFKEKGIKNHSTEEVLHFLKTGYRWSGFPDYAGIKNFPSITERNLILDIMGGEKGVEDNIIDWIAYNKEFAVYESVINNIEPDRGRASADFA